MAEELHLGIDLVLNALIGPNPAIMDRLIDEAKQKGNNFVIIDLALYCAFRSIRTEDAVNAHRFAELLKLSRFSESSLPKEEWVPTDEEIAHWRRIALQQPDENE